MLNRSILMLFSNFELYLIISMRNKVMGDVNQNMKTYQSPETFIFYRCIVDLILVDLKIILLQNDDLNSLDKFMAYIRIFYKKLFDLFQ